MKPRAVARREVLSWLRALDTAPNNPYNSHHDYRSHASRATHGADYVRRSWTLQLWLKRTDAPSPSPAEPIGTIVRVPSCATTTVTVG
jgi:hypothetical protein